MQGINHKVQYRDYYGNILVILLLSRVGSETINTFVFDKANYLWSLCALACIAVLVWPLLTMLPRLAYFPVFAYLCFMLTRTDFGNLYSIKCFFSEFIVWFFFVFTAELSSRDSQAASRVRTSVVWAVKIVLIVALAQMAFFLASAGTLSPTLLVESRAVHGIFHHPNIYIVVVLPFLLFFIKQRSYPWILIAMITCLATGTRSPFVALLCLSIPLFKSVLKRPITRVDITCSLIITIVTYYLMIKANLDVTNYDDSPSRLNFASLQWRIQYWTNFLILNHDFSSWFGHGVGSADFFDGALTEYAPHNDYLRIYYDTGILGIFLLLNLIIYILRLLMRSVNVLTDFIVIAYLVLICFFLTDNFVYYTHSLWFYVFMATFISIPSARTQKRRSQVNV